MVFSNVNWRTAGADLTWNTNGRRILFLPSPLDLSLKPAMIPDPSIKIPPSILIPYNHPTASNGEGKNSHQAQILRLVNIQHRKNRSSHTKQDPQRTRPRMFPRHMFRPAPVWPDEPHHEESNTPNTPVSVPDLFVEVSQRSFFSVVEIRWHLQPYSAKLR